MTMSRRAVLGGLALIAAPLPPRETHMMTLDELEEATEHAAGAYMSGTADLTALSDRMLVMLRLAAEYNHGRTARRAHHVMAWQCAVLAALASANGNLPMVKAYANTVQVYGNRAGDAQAVSRAYIDAAKVECWPGGDPAKAARLATEGLHLTNPTAQREQYARLCAILMEAHAQLGNRPGFEDAYALAHRAHAYLDAKPSALFGFSSQQMYQALANASADMGDRAAVDYAEMSIIRFPGDLPLVRQLAEYPKAYALAKTGDPDAAIEVAIAATTSTTPPSWFQKDRSRRILGALPEAYDSPRKRELQELVTSP